MFWARIYSVWDGTKSSNVPLFKLACLSDILGEPPWDWMWVRFVTCILLVALLLLRVLIWIVDLMVGRCVMGQLFDRRQGRIGCLGCRLLLLGCIHWCLHQLKFLLWFGIFGHDLGRLSQVIRIASFGRIDRALNVRCILIRTLSEKHRIVILRLDYRVFASPPSS